MITHISNGTISASIDSFGAQLTSLSAHNKEYLWQGNPQWWSGQAPILFPIVGTLRNDQAHSAAGEVKLGRHGLARRFEHTLLSSDETSAQYELRSTEETRKQFPYDFVLRMSYSLIGPTTLEQRYEVENTGTVELPYTVGAHPAFNAPLDEEETFEDYELKFARAWSYASPSLDHESGLLDFDHTWEVLKNADSFSLTHDPFREHDTIVFQDVPDNVVTLQSKKTSHGVRVSFTGFKYLGVWSEMHDAPFVAIEPWMGCATALDEDDMFEHKRGMELLAPGATARHAFTIELL